MSLAMHHHHPSGKAEKVDYSKPPNSYEGGASFEKNILNVIMDLQNIRDGRVD